jgi:hypothetical protein
MKTSSRTPYEVRLELLQLAFNVLLEQHKARSVSDGRNQETAPTTEEVIAEAEKMNGFISKANQHN